ncbi:hypothetical protein BVV20_00920 [Xanthomonas oryzae pv. oryzae]|nr:DUF3325 family protein [Xanthomonas oryzae]AUJ14338.1 hypothetical protein BVV20_00920 [Xanthomonas oryzae pv. oryzae]
MKQGFRQSMAWLHTWTGLLVGWVLVLIFMGGTASYYRDEISRWMRPELPTTTVRTTTALRSAEQYLQTHAADAVRWNITLPDPRTPVVSMYWQQPARADGKPAGRRQMYGNAIIDPATGKDIAARDTLGGEFFYRLHFDLHHVPVGWARYIAGFCAMFMLVAIISAVITHKKIFKDFFTFRPGKGLRSWLDFHNVSAVTALPHHAMITDTGVVTLMFMYLPWGIKARHAGDDMRYFSGFAALCRAMDTHRQALHGRVSGAARSRQLRVPGWFLLVLTFGLAVQAQGWGIGPVLWLGTLTAAAALLSLSLWLWLLPYRRGAIVPAALAASVLAGVVQVLTG